MSTFAERSHPDYRLDGEAVAAPPLDRNARTEYLRELHGRIAAMPDAVRESGEPCLLCGVALDVRLGKHSGVWFITHRSSRTCTESGSLWRVNAPDRATAIELWRESEVL